MAKAEFPTTKTLSDRGRLFIGLVETIAAGVVINEPVNSELMNQLIITSGRIGKFTSAELDLAILIGNKKGGVLLEQIQVAKERGERYLQLIK